MNTAVRKKKKNFKGQRSHSELLNAVFFFFKDKREEYSSQKHWGWVGGRVELRLN